MITFPQPRMTIGIMDEVSSFVDPIIFLCSRVPCVGELIEGYYSTPMLVTRVVHHVSRMHADAAAADAHEIEIDATVWVISEERRSHSIYLHPTSG